MKKVLFFGHTEWSTGRVYFELCKRLYVHGIDCHLLNWERSYSLEEIKEQNQVTECWVSPSSGIATLHYQYNVPLEKCILLLYHPVDITVLQHYNIDVTKLNNFATVAPWIQQQCSHLPRVPSIISLGINTHTFNCKPSESLKTIGFGSAFNTRERIEELKRTNPFEPATFKRPYLVKEIAESLGLGFKAANQYHKTYNTMPGFYKEVDCIICASEDEGAGGPVVEGGAAGKLVITTNVGSYKSYITDKGADGVPVPEQEFVAQTTELLKKYINDPLLYRNRCQEIQSYALKAYDWDNFIDGWVNLFNK
jgi:glycosyltransferase involved in cell wall biosynthesis